MNAPRLVYLVRHGIAEEPGPDYPDDADRPLTAEGRQRVREIGQGLVALDVRIDVVLTSPFVRTRQTADILAHAFAPSPEVRDLAALAVGGRSGPVLTAVGELSPGDAAMLVGHMPGIGVLAAELLAAGQPLEFKKGAVACVSIDGRPRPGSGTLLWFATPRILRLLSKG